jgi:hypothetical protein
MAARFEDWPSRLEAFLRAEKDRAFVWGERDCALFAADAVLALTGVDHAAAFRGRYSSARGALRALKVYGRGTLEATVAEKLGPVVVNPRVLQRGDLAAFGAEGEFGCGLGVVDLSGRSFIALSLIAGLMSMPLAAAVCGWRV